ncbi:MAG: helix-turn-helix transcriptional regulator [Alphaproteobacteria bacterium]|nr:helix-turn-helix transcriptional regulator [Alphaproteobacteria bacterium]MDE2494168.1 helix-turn-helix transcriptional regulator [Alphaproteobacteria bacterium]
MELNDAVKRLSALAQDSRLQVFTLLVKAGPEGVAAGDIARTIGIPATTLSAHLLLLSNARLVCARREGRSIFYSVQYESMRELLVFLTKDCCGGHPEVCAPLGEFSPRSQCRESTKGELRETPARARRRR